MSGGFLEFQMVWEPNRDEDQPEWVPELHESPEWRLHQEYSPLHWLKKDSDAFHRAVEEMMR